MTAVGDVTVLQSAVASKIEGQKTIPVFFNTDNRYALPTYITLYSLLANHHGSSRIDAYILTTGDFAERYTQLFDSLCTRYQNLRITIIDMEHHYESVKINISYISPASLYRLMIPDIVRSLPDTRIDKCIYLDSDLVIEGDIEELYDVDMEGFPVCGIRDRYLSSPDLADTEINTHVRKSLAVPSLSDYINSGVMLLSLRALDESGKSAELIAEGYNQAYRYNDQDVINKILYGKIKILPLRFNVFTAFIYLSDKDMPVIYGKEEIREARKDPLITHYVADKKPWSHRTMYMASKWWKYVKMQEREVIRAHFEPYAKEHRAPARVLVKDFIKTAAIHLHLYNLTRDTYHLIKRKH